MPLSADAKRELWELFLRETQSGKQAVEISASALHGRLENKETDDPSSYSTSNRMAVCRAVLVAMMDNNFGDEVTSPSEADPSVRFVLPRPGPNAPPV